jgi:cysteine desulfurase/selenocysteine lyase
MTAADGGSAAVPQIVQFLRPRPRPPAASAAVPAPGPLDPLTIRGDFPILSERINGRPLVWLDNAATTQKPLAVIDRLSAFYRHENSNTHRAAHTLAARATDAYEQARASVRRFLNARSPRDVIFTRGTTEAINLVAHGWGRRFVQAGDEILLSELEHHANIVPWQMLAAESGARLRVMPIDANGDLRLDAAARLIGPRTKLVAVTHVSNALGSRVPVADIVALARSHGARVLVDGAQAVSHDVVDVQALGADFYVFSGHKVFGPTGVGVLCGTSEVLDAMAPWQGGGNMIAEVTFERTSYQPAPARFEAGTGNIADVVALGAALEYAMAVGMARIAAHEQALVAHLDAGLREIDRVRVVGRPRERVGAVSFVVDGWRTEDVGEALDRHGVAVRAGHHCAQPALRHFGLATTIRPSVAAYNTHADVEACLAALRDVVRGEPPVT